MAVDAKRLQSPRGEAVAHKQWPTHLDRVLQSAKRIGVTTRRLLRLTVHRLKAPAIKEVFMNARHRQLAQSLIVRIEIVEEFIQQG